MKYVLICILTASARMTKGLEILYFNEQERQRRKAVTQSFQRSISCLEEKEPDSATWQHWGPSVLTAG